jgi:cyclopropane fatty-acyl-phospholipid synthase-like methyltransferase
MTTLLDIPLETATGAGRYWSGSAARPWVRDMSHWRGQGRWSDDRQWIKIGQQHLAMVDALVTSAGRRQPLHRAMEWGPGGGSNAVALAARVEEFVGVDISLPNLQECERQLAASGRCGVQMVHIPAEKPSTVLEHVKAPLDLFLSTAVFQHFPSKSYGIEVLNLAHRMLAPGGLALIQTRYDDGSEHVQCKSGDYNDKSAVTFTSFRIDEFWRIAAQAGFEPMYLTLQPEPLYAYYAMRAMK